MLKYIIVDFDGLELPVVFQEILTHSNVAHGAGKPISAGFVEFEDNKAFCFGDSVSLGIRSRKQIDSDIITKFFFRK